MSVTNLTGTSWLIKAAPSIGTMSRYINFTSDGSSSVSFIRLRMSSSSPSYIRYYYGTTNYDDVYQKSGIVPGTWTKTGYRTIHITGGDDVTDATLISWLESNATQILDENKMYVGVDGQASKITKGYVGVGNQAKKITHAYIGVNNEAKKIF